MNRILSDLINAGRMYLRSTVGLFFTIAFPVLLILLFGAIFTQGGGTAITLHVQNLDDGVYSIQLMEVLNQSGQVEMEMIPESEDINQYINDNSLSFSLLIPADFTEEIQNIQIDPNMTSMAQVTLYADPSSSSYGVAYSVVDAASTFMNYELSGARPMIGVGTGSGPSDSYTFMDFFLPGIIGLTIMTTTLFGMTSTCAEYRSHGYFKLLATTLLKKSEWLVSRFIVYSLILTVSLLLTFAVGMSLYDMSGTLTLMVFAFLAVGVLLFSGLGMLLGTVIKDPETGVAIANAIGFPMMFLSGSFFDVNAFPDYMITIAKVLPLTYLNDGLRDTMIFGNTDGALFNMAILIIIAAIFFISASKLMSWKEK